MRKAKQYFLQGSLSVKTILPHIKIRLLAALLTVLPLASASAQSTLALQEKCSEAARKYVMETGGCKAFYVDEDSLTFCEHSSHYNRKLDKCFARVEMQIFWNERAPDSLKGRLDEIIRIADVFENRVIGRYYKLIDFVEFRGEKLKAKKEFESLARPYMEE